MRLVLVLKSDFDWKGTPTGVTQELNSYELLVNGYRQYRNWLCYEMVFVWQAPFLCPFSMMTSSNENIFRVTGLFWRELIHRSSVNSPYKGQWGEALMFSFICAWTNSRINNGNAGDLRRHRVHYDFTVMLKWKVWYFDPFHWSLFSRAQMAISHYWCR